MTLSSKQVRMLELLDKQVMNCNKIGCGLNINGTAKPFWTPNSKYAIIGEAPGYTEVRKQTPFVGAAGNILTEQLLKAGFQAKEFLIINTVQCRPIIGNRNAKPTDGQISTCQSYLRKYLKVVNPEKILCLGNYAKFIFTGKIGGITGERGIFRQFRLDGSDEKYNVLLTFHPAYCIYNREEAIPILEEDIKLFKESEFEREGDWLLSKEEFMIL